MNKIKTINAVILFSFVGICIISTIFMAWGTLLGDSSAIPKMLAAIYLFILMA